MIQRPNGSRWRKLRQTILKRDALCRYCLRLGFITPSDTVDHAKALMYGGDNSPHNLVGCCRSCNSLKAIQEQSFKGDWDDLKTAAPVRGSLAWFIQSI